MIKRISFIALFVAGIAFAVNSQDRTVGNNLDFQDTNSIKRLKELGLKKLTSGATPPAGSVNIYAKSDGNLYKKDESGNESPLGVGEGGSGGIIINKNPGFEQGTLNWTASGGSFATTTESSNVGFGTQAASWDPSASGQTLSGDLVTVPAGLYGKICSLSFYYKGGDSNIKAQVFDGANVIAESAALSSASTYSGKQYIRFPCPNSGQLQARFYSSGDAAQIYIDDVRLGQEPLDLFNIGGATFDGQVLTSECQTPDVTSSSFVNPTCSGTQTATPGYTGSNLQYTFNTEIGYKYKATFIGSVIARASLNGAYVRLTDGTTNSAVVQHYNPDTINSSMSPFTLEMYVDGTGSSKTISVQLASSTTAGAAIVCNASNGSCSFNVEKIPTTSLADSSKAISIDKSGWMVRGKIAGTAYLSSTSVPTPTEITNSSLIMTLYSGSAQAEIPCSGTNPSTGLTCSAGDESVGVAFIPPTAGNYEVCFWVTDHMVVPNGSTFAGRDLYLAHTPNNGQTNIEISHYVTTGFGSNVGSISQADNICHTFTFSDTSKKTIRLKYTQDVGGSPLLLSNVFSLSFQVKRLVEFQDAVKFTNLVTTPRLNGLKTIFANVDTVCSTSPCTITSQSGGVSNIVRNSAGNYTMNFDPGTWTSNPYCVPTSYTGTVVGIAGIGNSTTSSFSFRGYNSSIVPTDGAFGVMCIGF